MLRPLSLVALFVRVSVQNLAAYRFDFFMRLFMSVMHLATELIAVWTIFHNTDSIRGWRWQHMLVLVGVFRMVAGGIRMSIVPNMRQLLHDIRDGNLDFALLKPVHTQFLVSIREFVVWRAADVVIGGGVAVYGCVALTGRVPVADALQFAVMMLAGGAIVYSIWLALATTCFWFIKVDNIEMVFWNVFEAGRYPIDVYRGWVQWLLTFIFPLAFITTLPAKALFGEASGAVSAAPLWAVGIAGVMLLASSAFWRHGLRHYSGASA